jgi:hypothetical protein
VKSGQVLIMQIGKSGKGNLTILPGNRPILTYSSAPTDGCNSLKMLADVAKCELALDGPTGFGALVKMKRRAPRLKTESV